MVYLGSMVAIFLDGESKSGKTAVGRSILHSLEQKGHNLRLLVAGNFFRQVTLLVLAEMPDAVNAESDEFEEAVRSVINSEVLLLPPTDMVALESPAVEKLVSRIGQLSFVQDAATEWRVRSAERAVADNIEILLVDGRNMRHKLSDWVKASDVTVALELVIFCRPEVAAARYLSDENVISPTEADLAATTENILKRRQNDKQRTHAAYVEPKDSVRLVVGTDSVDRALELAFEADVVNPPRPIRFDNSEVPREDGLRTVTELADKAIARLQS